MSSSATSGKGTVLTRNGSAIAEVRSLSGPSMKAETIDVTNMDSGGWREFITSLKDGGEVTFSVNFLPADSSQVALLQAFIDSDIDTYVMTFTDADTTDFTFSALCTGFSITAKIDDALMADITLKVSGAPTMDGIS